MVFGWSLQIAMLNVHLWIWIYDTMRFGMNWTLIHVYPFSSGSFLPWIPPSCASWRQTHTGTLHLRALSSATAPCVSDNKTHTDHHYRIYQSPYWHHFSICDALHISSANFGTLCQLQLLYQRLASSLLFCTAQHFHLMAFTHLT